MYVRSALDLASNSLVMSARTVQMGCIDIVLLHLCVGHVCYLFCTLDDQSLQRPGLNGIIVQWMAKGLEEYKY